MNDGDGYRLLLIGNPNFERELRDLFRKIEREYLQGEKIYETLQFIRKVNFCITSYLKRESEDHLHAFRRQYIFLFRNVAYETIKEYYTKACANTVIHVERYGGAEEVVRLLHGFLNSSKNVKSSIYPGHDLFHGRRGYFQTKVYHLLHDKLFEKHLQYVFTSVLKNPDTAKSYDDELLYVELNIDLEKFQSCIMEYVYFYTYSINNFKYFIFFPYSLNPPKRSHPPPQRGMYLLEPSHSPPKRVRTDTAWQPLCAGCRAHFCGRAVG